jgi:acyl-CoA reductase-like NAD-dependent aldehyde dehydrogenase
LNVGLDQVVKEVIHGAFYQSGQSCISVQRLLVNADIYDEFKTAFVDAANSLKAGDPMDEDTFIGPLIDEGAAEKVESWVQEAVDGGATLLTGGKRFDRVFVSPAIVENPPRDCKLATDEVFGPAVTIEK